MKAIERALTEDADCTVTLQRVAAARGAINGLMDEIVEDHLREHVAGPDLSDANPRFSFGTGKVGDLAGFASALVLGLIALGIAVESIVRLLEPTPVAFGQATLVAILGLGVNIVSALLLSGGHHHHHGHHHHDHLTPGTRHQDNNLRSAYVHVLADALTSVLAIAALIASRYLNWVWLDPAMGIVGAVVIARWSLSLMRDTAAVLLDTTDVELEAEVREHVEAAGDVQITDLHVWRVGPGRASSRGTESRPKLPLTDFLRPIAIHFLRKRGLCVDRRPSLDHELGRLKLLIF